MRHPTQRQQPQLHQRTNHPQRRHRTRQCQRQSVLLRVRQSPPPRRRQRLVADWCRLQLGHPGAFV